MNDIFYSSKDQIKNRILKNAREFWGINNIDDFDPMVKLMLEALSNELFNISNEVQGLSNRMFDKVASILSSNVLTSALPAHGILHAKSVEATEVIDEATQFYYSRKVIDKEDSNVEKNLDIFFSPLGSTQIFDAGITFIATGDSLFEVNSHQVKNLAAHGLSGKRLQGHTVFLGLDLVETVDSLNGMNFYFDWRNYVIEEKFYELLPLVKFYIADRQLDIESDRFFDLQNSVRHFPFDEHDVMNSITQDVHSFYSNRFLTVSGGGNGLRGHRALYPKEFEQVFSFDSLSRLNQSRLWLKLVFPFSVEESVLKELHISVNAFPVVNKQIFDLKYRSRIMSDIVPLKLVEEHQFLNIRSLKDNLGNAYAEIPEGYGQERSAGLFSVRYGGTERFDNRNAKEMLDYLFELLRDEKAAFAVYGADFLDSALTELEQNIAMIVQKISTGLEGTRELLNYVVVKPIGDADTLFLEYATTLGESGNGIAAGSILHPYEHTKVKTDGLRFLSNTKGGRSRLSVSGRTQAYKFGITTANRIVTHEDIINFCFNELGNNVSKVKIQQGLVSSPNPKEGFIRTVDLLITPAMGNGLGPDDWTELLSLTHAKLNVRSTMNRKYRLMISS